MKLWQKLKRKSPGMKKDVPLVYHKASPVATTPTLPQVPSHLTNQTGSLVFLLGSKSGTDNMARKGVARPQLSNRSRLRVQNSINDNYCLKCVTGQENCVYVSGKVV